MHGLKWPSYVFISMLVLVRHGCGQDPESLFFAGRTTSLDNSEVIVRYPVINVNVGLDYDPLSSVYTAPATAVTAMFYGCGTRHNAVTDFSLRQRTNLVTGIYSGNTAFNGHVSLSRMQLMDVEADVSESTHMDPLSKLYSNLQLETYFAGYSISGDMDIVSGLSAGLTTSMGSPGVVLFNMINVDTDASYEPMVGLYTVPRTGAYYVSASIAVPAGSPAEVSIVNSVLGELLIVASTSTNHNGATMATNAMMFYLTAGSTVSARLNSGSLYGDDNQGVSLNLFYYSLALGNGSVWSVYCLDDHTAQGGNISPYPFEGAHINSNGVWDFQKNRAYIQKAGTYLIHINAGSVVGVNTVIQLYAGALHEWYVGLSQNSTNSDGWVTFGRDVLVTLNIGDEVYTRLMEDTAAHSYLTESVSITGVLLKA